MQVPLDPKLKELSKIPYTFSFIIRKRQQIDSFMELPKEKRPTEWLMWSGTPEEIDEWMDKIFSKKPNKDKDIIEGSIVFDIDEIEG